MDCAPFVGRFNFRFDLESQHPAGGAKCGYYANFLAQ